MQKSTITSLWDQMSGMRISVKASEKTTSTLVTDIFYYINWPPKLYQSQQNRANCPICSADSANDHTNFRRRRQPEQLRLVQESFQRQDKESEWVPHTRHFLHISRIQVNKYTQHLSYKDFVRIGKYNTTSTLTIVCVCISLVFCRKK